MKTFSRILAPTDFSELSRRAIRFAVNEARVHEAELHLFHSVTTGVVGHPMDPAVDIPATGDVVNEAQQSLLRFPEAAFEEDSDNSSESGCAGSRIVRTVLQGHPEVQIVEYAREQRIELVVLATHARSGVERMFMGSTAEAVLRHAPCPVMVVPPPENE